MLDLTARPVVIPDLSSVRSIMPILGSHQSVPLIYNGAYNRASHLISESLTTITEPIQIAGMLSLWFFRGLQSVSLNLKPDTVSVDHKGLLRFVSEILQDREPRHEHKMAFLTWVLHTCCESITYQIKA